MEQKLLFIYKNNIRILRSAQKAMYSFRSQEYGQALSNVIDVIDHIGIIVEEVLKLHGVFEDEVCKEICDLLSYILEAKRQNDMVLLSDLLGIQLVQVIQSLQSMILNYSIPIYDSYEENKERLYRICKLPDMSEEEVQQYHRLLEEPLNRNELIDQGYRIEATASGVMTAACLRSGCSFYLHSNYEPLYEAYLWAKHFYQPSIDTYIVYGLGLSYHVQELCELVGDKKVIVFESDIELLKLSCAFTNYDWVDEYPQLTICYDLECNHFMKTVEKMQGAVSVCIHYPSLHNITNETVQTYMKQFIPYSNILEIS